MFIYTEHITHRKQYIFDVLFFNVLSSTYTLTDSREEFLEYRGPKFVYGDADFHGVPKVRSCGLLDETDLHPCSLAPVEWNGYKLFFPVDGDALFPFDLFSVAFYLLTRYEEYLPSQRDEHQRFRLENSVAYKYGFHRLPMAQILAVTLARKLEGFYPEWSFSLPAVSVTYTCDVDVAYKYRGKGCFRWCGGLLRALLNRQGNDVENYFRTLLHRDSSDPYDVFQQRTKLAESLNINVIHFIPTGDYGRYDKNVSHNSKCFRRLLKSLPSSSEIGLHPSYLSFDNENKLKKEKERLENVLNQCVTKSRNHYLRFSFPETPRRLLNAGIREDYSLGWPDDVGFRCSTSVPYPFFDLLRNVQTDLLLHPLTVMDVALERLSSAENERSLALDEVFGQVKKMGGEFVLLNHNSSPSLLEKLK